MIYNKEKYLYVGYVVKPHGGKGKVIVLIRRHIPVEKFPSRIFIKMINEKDNKDILKEFKVRRLKMYKENLAIFLLDKIKSREDAESLSAHDIYIKEKDLPTKVKIELGTIPAFLREAKEIDKTHLEYIGMITKPRGLKGAVNAIVHKEKLQRLEHSQKVFIELEGKLFETEVRKVRKIREMRDNAYISLELSEIYDVNSAEKLRKGKIFR